MGRSSERDNIQAGTHSVIYDNRDRRFDPTNTSSAYSPNVLPMKKSQLRATWSGTTYDLATGYADSWEQVVVNTGQVQSQLSAVDAMGVLNTSVFSTPATVDPPNHDLRVSERSDQRIAWVLDQIGFPAADRSLDTGQVAIQAFAFDNYNALQHIGDVVEAEVGCSSSTVLARPFSTTSSTVFALPTTPSKPPSETGSESFPTPTSRPPTTARRS
jgi:hypothetical protein